MTSAAIDGEMNRVFEGTDNEMVAWLNANSIPHYSTLYLIRDSLGRVLTVSEFLDLNA